MSADYTGMRCGKCKKEFILLSDDLLVVTSDVYCPFCRSSKTHVHGAYNNLNETMKARCYKRNKHGALEQIKF